jgi:hypothetical protein
LFDQREDAALATVSGRFRGAPKTVSSGKKLVSSEALLTWLGDID